MNERDGGSRDFQVRLPEGHWTLSLIASNASGSFLVHRGAASFLNPTFLRLIVLPSQSVHEAGRGRFLLPSASRDPLQAWICRSKGGTVGSSQ